MSDEEHSDSEFYYPEDEQEEYDTNFHQFLSNEEQPSELFEQQNTENSQEEIDNFLKQQRSKNTLNKTSSDMKAFSRYLQTTNKQYLSILNLLLLLALSRKKKRTNCLNANSLACLDQKRTVWWLLALHFGFRARDESRKLCWGDIQLQKNSDGCEMLVWLCERGTKTRHGQENGRMVTNVPFSRRFTLPVQKDVL